MTVAAEAESVPVSFLVLDRAPQPPDSDRVGEAVASYELAMADAHRLRSAGAHPQRVEAEQVRAAHRLAWASELLPARSWAWPYPGGAEGWDRDAHRLATQWSGLVR